MSNDNVEVPLTAESHARSERLSPRKRWRSWLALGLLGTVLTFVGLTLGTGELPQIELFWTVEGISEADMRHRAEIRKLGGESHIMERSPRFLGRFGGHDLLFYSFSGKSFDDEALARFIKTYGDRVWGLSLADTSVSDAGLRYLADLPHIKQLALGNLDPRHALPGAPVPQSKLTDAGLVHLKGLSSLGNLNLGGLPVTDAGLDTLKDLPNLGGLYLDRTLVRGAGLGRWKSLPGLALIYLDGSPVSEEGLANLKGATNLQLLSLAGVPLTGAGLNHLKAVPKLNQLDIKGCGLSFEEIDGFQVARPGVKLQ